MLVASSPFWMQVVMDQILGSLQFTTELKLEPKLIVSRAGEETIVLRIRFDWYDKVGVPTASPTIVYTVKTAP